MVHLIGLRNGTRCSRHSDQHGRARVLFGQCKDGAFLAVVEIRKHQNQRECQLTAAPLRSAALCERMLVRQISSTFRYRSPDEVYFGTCNRHTTGYSKPKGFITNLLIKVVQRRGEAHIPILRLRIRETTF